jgi:predicted DsbA family dithiol-disulfide isomerase
LSLEELYASRNVDPGQAKARQKRIAEELGLPFGERTKTYNSRLATELGKWAESKGQGDAFHSAVFRAYYVDGVNIAKADELLKLARAVGLPGEEAGEVLNTRSFREAVDADWDLSCARGISAIPTFVLDDAAVVGAQSYEVLEKFLVDHMVERK